MSTGIAVRDLTVRRAGRPVLHDVSFDAARGRVLALAGASGSGKSTLLRCLNRLAEAESGTITLDGSDIRALDPPALRRRVALVAQAPVMLPGTVADNLAYGLAALPDDARDTALAAAGLDPTFLPRTARALSGGERARVALARALTRDPDAILLDEPTAALDPDTALHIAETITALAKRDLIVIVATHDLALAEAVAEATLRLAGGNDRVSEVTSDEGWYFAFSIDAAVLQVACGIGFVALAVLLAHRLKLGLSKEIAVAALRATVQLAAVGALIALVFKYEALAIAFVAAMITTAALTSGGRLDGVPQARARAIAAIGIPAVGAATILIAVGAFEPTPEASIPTAGILIGGAMTATTLTGRRLLEGLRDDADAIETRLALGDRIRDALAPTVRQAIKTGLIPAIDQTRNVGIVTLPGTFVGLVLGGASPGEAARIQLTVLLTLLAVELLSAIIIAELIVRTRIAPGERLREDVAHGD